jgi:hypothetical protein
VYATAKVNYLFREEDGRFFCMHDSCKDKTSQSFQWRNGFQVSIFIDLKFGRKVFG